MISKELDVEMLKLEREYKELDRQYEDLDSEIDSLQGEKDDVESEMEDIEDKIIKIKKKMQSLEIEEIKIEDLNIQTNDKFTMDFIKASYFTYRNDNDRPILNIVNITCDELQAVDGFRGIVIKNNDIPMELQNKKIHWEVRENFKDNISKIESEFIKIHSIIPKKEDAKYSLTGLTSEKFYERLHSKLYEQREKNSSDIIQLFYHDFKIAFRKDYIDDALMILKGETFSAYFNTNASPMLLESENKEIIILPIRLMRE